MAAELRLGVSFDLAYFRTQLDKLGRIAASEFTAPIKIKLDRQVVDRELNNLQRSIKRRTYKVELNIAGNLSKKSFDELQERLDTLGKRQKVEVPVSVKNAATGKDISEAIAALRARIAQNQSVKQGGGKLRIGVSIQAAISNDDVANFRKAVKEKFAGITNRADVSIGVKNAASGKDVANTVTAIRSRINQNQSIKQGDGKLRVGLSIKPAITNADIAGFKRAVEEKFSGLSVKIKADVQAGLAPSAQGSNAPGSARRPSFLDSPAYKAERESLARSTAASLSKAARDLPEGRSRQEIERLLSELSAQNLQGKQRSAALDPIRDLVARARYQQGLGIEARLQPIRGQQGISAPRSMPNLNQMLDRIANLTENPRAAQRMLRMMPENRLTTDLIGAANRQAVFKEAGPGKFLDLKGKAFDPLLKSIAESFSDYTRSVNSSNPWVGKIGNGLGKFIERALTLSPEQMFGGRAPIPGSRLLPAAGQSSASRMMRSAFSGLPAIEAPQIGGEGAPLSRAASYMLNKARQVLGLPIGPTSAYTGNPFAGAASVPQGLPRSYFQFGGGPQLPGSPLQLALPPAGMTSAARTPGYAYDRVTGIGGGAVPGGGGGGGGGGGRGGALAFPGGGMGPSSALPGGYFQTQKLAAGIRGIGADFNQARLPLSGAVRELGGEFATATKQVLLFGTAYKALAFFTSLPGQAFEAAKGLQTINNQLQAVTGSVQNADRSFAFIDNLANRFNVPLQSARDGFVKLYASMEPAGFSGSEIEGLFEGISKATATFGLSADQVDRVNYAFAQMASKGQIMSEELKGQLGDVLPGSLALFAEAAQMSIPEFSKAMEDGAFKGEAMAQVLRNVAKIMNSDFGGAAANAANTLQGALNGMQNAVQRLYEAFEPLVDAVASQAFPLIQDAIAEATAAVTAFGATIQGNEGPANMLEGNARALYNTMLSVREVFTAVGRIIQGLVPTFTLLGQVIITIADAISRVINTQFGGFLVDVALKVGIGMIAVQAFARVMGFQLVAALVTAAQSATTFVGSIKAMVIALRSSEVAARAFRLAMTGLVVGAVLIGLEKLVEHIGRVANRLRDARKAALEAKDAILSMSTTQLIEEKQRRQTNVRVLESLEQRGTGQLSVNRATAQRLREMGMSVSQTQGRQGERTTYQVEGSLIRGYLERERELLSQAGYTLANKDFTPGAPGLEKVDLAAADGSGGRGAKERESQVLQLQLRLELSKKLFDIDMRLAEARLKENTALETELELVRKLTELDYQRREILLENIPDNEKALKIEELKLQRQQAILASQLKLRLDLNNQFMKSQDALTKIIDAQVEETSYAKKYQELVLSGVNPALAKTTVEVTKRFAEEVKSLDTQIQQLEVSIATAETTIELLKLKESLTDTEKEQLDNAQKNLETFREHLRLRKQAKGEVPEAVQRTITEQQAAEARNPFGVTIAEGYERAKQELEDLADPANMLVSAANSIGDAFGQMFTDIATGAQTWREALGNAFRSVASMFADMVAQMLAKWAAMQILQMFLPGGKAPGGQQPGLTAGIQQYPLIAKANGGVLAGGFQAFASGGVVTGPTLGLVGEGRFNEAVVPLPNGKSIPVELGDGAGSNISTNIVVNVNNGQASSQVNGAGGQSLGRELEGAVRGVILKESRPGGIIYNQR